MDSPGARARAGRREDDSSQQTALLYLWTHARPTPTSDVTEAEKRRENSNLLSGRRTSNPGSADLPWPDALTDP